MRGSSKKLTNCAAALPVCLRAASRLPSNRRKLMKYGGLMISHRALQDHRRHRARFKDSDMNKQTSKETPTVANAEAMLARFEREHAELVERKAALANKRRDVAYAAHAGDGAAVKMLDGVHREAAELESRIASVTDAVNEAKCRRDVALKLAAKAADRARAQVIRDEWAAARKDFADLDAGLSFAVGAAQRLYDRYAKMQAHGLRPPPQLQLMLGDVLTSALMALPPPLWKQFNFQGLEHLPPNRRRNAASLADAWASQTEQQAVAIGGEPQQQTGNAPEAA
jgi:hypothetical protein